MDTNLFERTLNFAADIVELTSVSRWFPKSWQKPKLIEDEYLSYGFEFESVKYSGRIVDWKRERLDVCEYQILSCRDLLQGIPFTIDLPTNCLASLDVSSLDSDITIHPVSSESTASLHLAKFHRPLRKGATRNATFQAIVQAINGGLGDSFSVVVDRPTRELVIQVAFPKMPKDGIVYHRQNSINGEVLWEETVRIDPVTLSVRQWCETPQVGTRYSFAWKSPA